VKRNVEAEHSGGVEIDGELELRGLLDRQVAGPLTFESTPLESLQSNGMAEAFVRTIKRDYVRVSPRPDAETVMRHLSDIVHPVSSSQLTQDPDRVRSFGGYNNPLYRAQSQIGPLYHLLPLYRQLTLM
jgi:hypothetical protein